MNAPRDWIDPWPDGHPRPDTPVAAIWLAELVQRIRDLGLDVGDLTVATGLNATTIRFVEAARTHTNRYGDAEPDADSSK